MEVRQVSPDTADVVSAELFFNQVTGFFNLSKARALDMFARTGALTVSKYVASVEELECWELNGEHKDELLKYTPEENIRIGCSYGMLREYKDTDPKFDLIVIDSPQGAHLASDTGLHYEHFDVVPNLKKMMKPTCIVVLHVNKRPYNIADRGSQGYDVYDEYNFEVWMEARSRFYRTALMTINEENAIRVYRGKFLDQGYKLKAILLGPCHSDIEGRDPYAFRLAMELVKIEKDEAI